MRALKKNEIPYLITEYSSRFGKFLTTEQLAMVTETKVQVIQRLVSFELIRPKKQDKFDVAVIPHVRKLMRLHYDLGVSWTSMDLILDLLDRIENLENKLGNEE